ncbi:MAG: hypothetical protein JXN62_08415, partial [Bacteroidales bacterium]|nr:hypothetical protein [Bacteroidales bacterium]
MKKMWIGGAVVVVVAVSVFVLTTKNTNDTKSEIDSTAKNAETAKQTEEMAARNTRGHKNSDLSIQSVDRGKFVYSEQNLSETVRELLGLNGDARHYSSMMKSIGQLSKELDADDVAALRDFLTWPNDVFPEGMREIEINSIKNDVLNNLLLQKELPEAIGYQLVDMFADTESDSVWKDYCVQFMSPYYERAAEEFATRSEAQIISRGNSERSERFTNTKEHENVDSVTSVSFSEAGGENMDELDAVREAMFAALDVREGAIAG